MAGLKLKPSKYFFLRQAFEYLGHRITPQTIDNESEASSSSEGISYSEGFEGDPTVPGSMLLLPKVHSTVCKDNPSTP